MGKVGAICMEKGGKSVEICMKENKENGREKILKVLKDDESRKE